MVINLDSVKYTVLSLFQMEWLLSYRINNEQYYKWQFDWAANQVTVRFDGAVTYLAKSIVCLTKCNSKVIVDYYYFINYYNYYYFQNEIHYYYYCEKCNRYYYYSPRSAYKWYRFVRLVTNKKSIKLTSHRLEEQQFSWDRGTTTAFFEDELDLLNYTLDAAAKGLEITISP